MRFTFCKYGLPIEGTLVAVALRAGMSGRAQTTAWKICGYGTAAGAGFPIFIYRQNAV